LQRRESTALIKELVGDGLVIPSLVVLKENNRGKFDLVLRGDCDLPAIRQFISEKNLLLDEDKEQGFFTIYRL
jgi:hypothetical protein